MRQTQSSALHKLQQLNADADEAFTNLSKPRGHANAERRSRLVPYTALLLALVGALTIVVSHESHDQASLAMATLWSASLRNLLSASLSPGAKSVV